MTGISYDDENPDVVQIDIESIEDQDLERLARLAKQEMDRRYAMAMIPGQFESLARQYLNSIGRGTDSEWVQPTNPWEAYPFMHIVMHKGKRWSSTEHGNMFKPGVKGWNEVLGAPTPLVREWTAGYHEGDTPGYALDAVVIHDGAYWKSTVPGNEERPTSASDRWRMVDAPGPSEF